MKNKYEVVDNAFNRANYSHMIGKVLDNPPAYANVRLIKEKPTMEDIYKKQSKMWMENNTNTMPEDFVIKCTKEGYNKEEIVNGLREFFRQAPDSGKSIYDRTIIKYLGIKSPEDKKNEKEEFKDAIKKTEAAIKNKWIKTFQSSVRQNDLALEILKNKKEVPKEMGGMSKLEAATCLRTQGYSDQKIATMLREWNYTEEEIKSLGVKID